MTIPCLKISRKLSLAIPSARDARFLHDTPGQIRKRLIFTTWCKLARRLSQSHPIHLSRASKCNAEELNPTPPNHPCSDFTR